MIIYKPILRQMENLPFFVAFFLYMCYHKLFQKYTPYAICDRCHKIWLLAEFKAFGRIKNEEDFFMSVISMKQLLEAGVHFGHQTRKWCPKMARYIFTARNDIHVINLEQTSECVDSAYEYVRDAVKDGKTVLFVGTKKQAQDAVKEEAERCGEYYINSRWLGGTLTNFKTIRSRIGRLNKLEQMEKTGEYDLLPKKEVAKLKAEQEKLQKFLGGIKDMNKLPGLIYVVDSKKEAICVKEAKLLGIPVVGLIDTNCDPDYVDVVIPGNDDAIRSVKLITRAIGDAVIEAKEGEEGLAARKKVEEEQNGVEADDKQDEVINMEEALNKEVPVEELEKDVEEKKPTKRKSTKKPVKKAEKETEKQENKEEVNAEEPKVEKVEETANDAE